MRKMFMFLLNRFLFPNVSKMFPFCFHAFFFAKNTKKSMVRYFLL